MKSTIPDQFHKLVREPETILELTPEMQVTPPALPAQQLDEPLPACIQPAHPTVIFRYLRVPYLRQLLGITEVARLPFELQEPQFGSDNLQTVSRELTITCTLTDMLYEKLATLKPEATESASLSDRNLCQDCIKAEREIRDRLLSVEADLQNKQHKCRVASQAHLTVLSHAQPANDA